MRTGFFRRNRKRVAFLTLFAGAAFLFPSQVRADFFGGDLPLLAEIVVNTTQQLTHLRQIIQNGDQSLGLIRDINRGINDSLNLLTTAFPHADPGVFKDWTKASDALRQIEDLYGKVATTRDAPVQRKTDQSVAEAIALNNSIYQYTNEMDELGESIKDYSHSVSPGGAQKLTAQSMGVMIHILNQNLRAQATGLKLQAEALALQNHREKEGSRYLEEMSQSLKTELYKQPSSFELPRF